MSVLPKKSGVRKKMTIQTENLNSENEVMFVCLECSQECALENEIHSENNICDYCFENSYFVCELCEAIFNNDNMFSQYVSSENRTMQLCRVDYRESLFRCDTCDEIYLISTSNMHDMDECRRQNEMTEQEKIMEKYKDVIIKPYMYKPVPQFKTTNRKQNAENYLFNNDKTFFGFELECVTDNRNAIMPVAEMVQNELNKNVYLKHDGSLEGKGFEIVSEPMSFNYFQQELSFEFLNILKENNFMSWDAKKIGVSCGIHVHVSKAGFNGNSHIYKFTQLILENKNEWVKMAGRNSKQWSSYDKNLTPILNVLHKKTYQPRYVAVNLSNEHTIEVRLFRGSLNETRFKSAIELVAGAVEYTRNISLTSIKNGGLNFNSFINYLNVYSDIYPNAIAIAKQKGLVK